MRAKGCLCGIQCLDLCIAMGCSQGASGRGGGYGIGSRHLFWKDKLLKRLCFLGLEISVNTFVLWSLSECLEPLMVCLCFLPPNRNDTKEDVFVHQVRGILAVILTWSVWVLQMITVSWAPLVFLESALSSALLRVVDKPSYPSYYQISSICVVPFQVWMKLYSVKPLSGI